MEKKSLLFYFSRITVHFTLLGKTEQLICVSVDNQLQGAALSPYDMLSLTKTRDVSAWEENTL